MIDRKTSKDALGWGCIGLAAVVIGLLLMAGGSGLGQPVAVVGGLLVVVCLAAFAYELLRSD